MSRTSENTLVSVLNGPRGKFVPFTAFVRIVPFSSDKRFEEVRDREKIGDLVEDALDEQDEGTEEGNLDFAFPVKTTPQFGDKTARLTIHGNVRDSGFTKTPFSEVTVINTGRLVTGNSNHHAASKEPSIELLDAVSTIKAAIEAALATLPASVTIAAVNRIEVAHMIFGEGGFSFPS